jgi:hypothetical protein
VPFLAAVAVLGVGAGVVIAVLTEGGSGGGGRGGGKMVVVVVSGEVGDTAVWFVIHSHPEWYVLERLTSSLCDPVVQWLVASLQ